TLPDLHLFPTRRSSDLDGVRSAQHDPVVPDPRVLLRGGVGPGEVVLRLTGAVIVPQHPWVGTLGDQDPVLIAVLGLVDRAGDRVRARSVQIHLAGVPADAELFGRSVGIAQVHFVRQGELFAHTDLHVSAGIDR